MQAVTKDGVIIEMESCDAGHAPLPPGEKWYGLNLNTSALWIRLPGKEWHRPKMTRSTVHMRCLIESYTIEELNKAISDDLI